MFLVQAMDPDLAADQDLDPSIKNGKKWQTVNPKMFFNLIASVS